MLTGPEPGDTLTREQMKEASDVYDRVGEGQVSMEDAIASLTAKRDAPDCTCRIFYQDLINDLLECQYKGLKPKHIRLNWSSSSGS